MRNAEKGGDGQGLEYRKGAEMFSGIISIYFGT